ncbi:MAG: NAD-dependent deacylase [Ignavibacteriaceae bacterium]|nr:NAD-dependent deacylase [Ignavibacteriaceae bacterium]
MIQVDNNLIGTLKESESIVFFTGAGISAESGIPTFRGKEGLWNKFRPEELASFDAFIKNPELVWEWYNYRRKIVHEAKPNAAHLTIAEMQNHFKDVTVVTQNVDNLHRRAGSKKIYELHGNIERNFCINCKKFHNEELDFSTGVPKCECGGLLRPDVVWFGEHLPEDQFLGGEKAAIKSDIFFVVGTSVVVYPAAGLIYTAKASGSIIVEINIEATTLSDTANYSFFGKAGEILPKIFEEYKLSEGL